MFVPETGIEQPKNEGGPGQIQPRLPRHLGIEFEYIDQDAGRTARRTVHASMQIPDQVDMKLIPIVFQQPGVTVGQLTGRGGSPGELSIEALQCLLLQARQLACETNPRAQADQMDRLLDLAGIVATFHRAGITTPASRTRHQVQVKQGSAVPPLHRFVFSAAAPRIRETCSITVSISPGCPS